MSKLTRLPVLLALASIAAAARAAGDAGAAPSAPQLEQRIDDLSRQLEEMKAQLNRMKEEQQKAQQQAQPPAAAAPAAPEAAAPSPLENISLWGYGEVYYTRPWHMPERTQADLARAVFGIGYRFDDRTSFNSEYEVEHAVSSASDVGEFEVEQFYMARQLNEHATVDAGLFLMPFGLLNEHHEPTNFYGVQRNFVETLIIPSTWREGGVNAKGDTDIGLNWSVGLTTGPDFSKWDFAPEFPPYTTALELEDNDVAPFQATHQELALANASHLAEYVALGYTGLPGLTVGGAYFNANGPQRATLWEGHVRWQPSDFDLSALYARGSIGNTAQLNLANPGSPNPIPASFDGYFFQAAYTGLQPAGYRIAPFVRYERYNMGRSYDGTNGPDLPSGRVPLSATPGDFGLWPRNHDRVLTYGANFYLNPHVVLKVDLQTFQTNSQFNRFDLGLGLNF